MLLVITGQADMRFTSEWRNGYDGADQKIVLKQFGLPTQIHHRDELGVEVNTGAGCVCRRKIKPRD